MNAAARPRAGGNVSTLADVFDVRELERCIAERMVVARKHPSRPLTILNYTERCQYERGLWNPVTLQCRGLIHDDSGTVIARPFPKFFNYGDQAGPQLHPDHPIHVTDKLDGSLGILYGSAGDRAIATRGSFESEQALHATELWNRQYEGFVTVPDGYTMLFEIIYPQNRIVLDYGERDALVLLGAVEIATGRSVPVTHPMFAEWNGLRAETFRAETLAEALTIGARPNAEGIVIHDLVTDVRVKLKQADYVELHKIITGLNERAVWRHLSEGKPLAALLDAMPDEFHQWVGDVAARLFAVVEASAAAVETAYSTIVADLPTGYSRKDFALIAKDHPEKAALFLRLDGRDYRSTLWERCKPSARLGPRGIAPSEETA